MSNNIYIYHIPGVKVGVTRSLKKRVEEQQGYKQGEYEVLEVHTNIEYISKKEKEWSRRLGYREDYNDYKTLSKQNKKGMDINITDRTVTFPVPVANLDGYLTDNLGFKFSTQFSQHILDDETANWIKNNARESHFNPMRSYVYNKTLAAFQSERETESAFVKGKTNIAPPEDRFERIRQWATKRNLYVQGDRKTQLVKLAEEMGEVARAIIKEDQPAIQDGIGDMVVVLTNLANLSGFLIEDCIDSAWDEIKDRTGSMQNGSFIKETL